MYRQGDVLLVPVDALPRSARRQDGPVTFPPGRTSVHPHAVGGDEIEAYLCEGATYLRVVGAASVTHPGHGPLAVPAGTYRLVRQRQYPDPRYPDPTYTVTIID